MTRPDGIRRSRQFWNRILQDEREKVKNIALEHTEKSPRELAWYITDTRDYFISEFSVYRIYGIRR